MICDDCRTVVEDIALGKGLLVPTTGGEKRRVERKPERVLRSKAAGCTICSRLTVSEVFSHVNDRSDAIHLQYEAAALDGFFQIRLSARSTAASIDDDFRGEISLTFALLPTRRSSRSSQDIEPISNTRIEQVKEYIQNRLTACQTEHSECRKGDWWRPEHERSAQQGLEKYWQPTRLLSIHEAGGSDTRNIRLIDTGDVHSVPYVALSHCWGGKLVTKLEADTFDKLTTGIACRNLPRTFQDAIEVALWLNINHIWIDSLCIIQDSTDDWTYESAQMHRVYQCADLTISASAAENSDSGLFFESQHVLSPFVSCLKFQGLDPSEYNIVHTELWAEDIDKGPLRNRAWTLQERMLSRRLLHFGMRQVFFQCARRLESESYPGDTAYVTAGPNRNICLLDDLGFPFHWQCAIHIRIAQRSKHLDHFRRMWHYIIRIYSSCDLTYQSDKLVAIGGLARWAHSWHGDQYFAGLWEESLLFQLHWNVVDCKQANGQPSKRPDQYVAPSWSWASVIGVIDSPMYLALGRDINIVHLAQVVEAKVQKAGVTAFGPISGGTLSVKGRLQNVIVRQVSMEPVRYKIEHDRNTIRINGQTVTLYFDVQPNLESQELALLPLWLRKGPGVTHGHDYFEGIVLKIDSAVVKRYTREGTISMSRDAYEQLGLDIQVFRGQGPAPVSRTWDGSDIVDPGFETIVIV